MCKFSCFHPIAAKKSEHNPAAMDPCKFRGSRECMPCVAPDLRLLQGERYLLGILNCGYRDCMSTGSDRINVRALLKAGDTGVLCCFFVYLWF